MIDPVNNILVDKAVKHAVYLERYKLGLVKSIIGFLNKDVYPDLVSRIERALLESESQTRLKELATSIKAFSKQADEQTLKRLSGELAEFTGVESQWQMQALKKTVPIAIDFRTPNPAVLMAIVDKPIYGKFLTDWVSEVGTRTASRVMQQVRIGIAEGQGIEGIVRRIAGTRQNRYMDGILQESRRNIQAIVRTSVNGVMSGVRNELYTANDDVIKGVQFVATLDARTTPICQALDGKVFEIGEGPRPPMHFNCRSTIVPVLKSWKELGINLKEAPSGTRASMNGQVSDTLTYNQWLKRQSADTQNDILGVNRADMFRTGKANVYDFVDANYKPLTLAQLSQNLEN